MAINDDHLKTKAELIIYICITTIRAYSSHKFMVFNETIIIQ
jgi:hypothetical protein